MGRDPPAGALRVEPEPARGARPSRARRAGSLVTSARPTPSPSLDRDRLPAVDPASDAHGHPERAGPPPLSASARMFASPELVSSAQTATAPCEVGTTSHHLMWSLVRATSAGAPRATPSRDRPRTTSDSPRSSSALHASSQPPRASPSRRTTSVVASCGTVATTRGSASGAPSAARGTTMSSCPPVSAATIQAARPAVAGPGDEGTDRALRDGRDPVRRRRRLARVERPASPRGQQAAGASGCASTPAAAGWRLLAPPHAGAAVAPERARRRGRRPKRRSTNGAAARRAAAPTPARARSAGTASHVP